MRLRALWRAGNDWYNSYQAAKTESNHTTNTLSPCYFTYQPLAHLDAQPSIALFIAHAHTHTHMSRLSTASQQ